MTDRAPRRRAPLGEIGRIAVLVAFVALGVLRSPNPGTLLTNTALWSISAVGVGLVLGLAGQPALCQASFMLVGAYLYAVVGRPEDLGAAPLVGVAVAVAGGMLLATLLSPVLRARGYTFALATIALDLFVRQAFRTGTWLPGQESGLAGIPPLRLVGRTLIDPSDYLLLALSVVVVGGTLLHRRYGRGVRRRSLQVLAGDQDLLAELGQRPAGLKRALFAIGGGAGALAGALTVASFGFVQPTTFTSRDSFALAVAVVIGGRDRLAGAVLGAVVYQMSAPILGPDLATWQPILLGVTVVAAMHLFPGGLLPRWESFRRWSRVDHVDGKSRADAGGRDAVRAALGRLQGSSLSVSRVTVEFGAVRAVDDVDLELGPGSVTALVGPNGSGKSTLLAAVASVAPTAGEIALDGDRLTTRPADVRARHGVARSHQHVRLVDGMTALDSVLVGVDLAVGRGVVTARRETERRALAQRCLDAFGVGHLADREVSELSHAASRFVDLARLCAVRPSLALLDEPSAGLDHTERALVIEAIGALREAGCTVLLVEHDLAFVRAVAARVVALVDGRVLASGPMDEVMSLPAFEAAYLGGTVVR